MFRYGLRTKDKGRRTYCFLHTKSLVFGHESFVSYLLDYSYLAMKIKVICISDSDKHFSSAIDEYLKRLGKDIEIITIKPERNGTHAQIIFKETEKIIEKLAKNKDYKILLSKDGKQSSTEEFVLSLNTYPSTTFIIGGPYGLEEDKLDKWINGKIAFGKITMPH